jgi:3-carboxymethyl-3-hydroxy-acyl-[acp] dehydratase
MDLIGHPSVMSVSLDREDGRNSIDATAISLIESALAKAEADPDCRLFAVTSGPGVFSTGMDLAAAAALESPEPGGAFFDLLRRLTGTRLIVVVSVDGKTAGGGMGLVAAADLVHATQRSTFALPEALWGLLPCVVLPFLARRIGPQRARTMMLTTQPVQVQTAASWGLVDVVADDLSTVLRPLAFRASKVDAVTFADAKRYAAAFQPVTDDDRQRAVGELRRLLGTSSVRERLAAFASHGQFPWQA